MIRFACDYGEGAHERIMARMMECQMEQNPGYGEDAHCARARELIKTACGREDVDVHFLVGGTQANATVITAALRPHQGVLCAQTGHISVHETGAVEASGHKVLPIATKDGRLSATQIDDALQAHYADETREHTVQPAMVYLSHPTETGMLYSLEALEAIRRVCDTWGLTLFVDGARLGYGVAALPTPSIADFARLSDVFYIGGTKVGALMGEAVVIASDALKKDFRYLMKRQGGMLAKGFLLGMQFETLFEDGLYLDIARHAVREALRIKHAFADHGVDFLYDSVTNQQFPILTKSEISLLQKDFAFEHWAKVDDDRDGVRFCTGWATKSEHVDALIAAISTLPARK